MTRVRHYGSIKCRRCHKHGGPKLEEPIKMAQQKTRNWPLTIAGENGKIENASHESRCKGLEAENGRKAQWSLKTKQWMDEENVSSRASG